MTVVATIALVLLAAAGGIALAAIRRGPTSADRMLALDLLLIVLAAGLAAGSVLTGRTDLLAVLLAVSLVAFVSTVAVGRTLEREGRK
jgi:multicomponent Na+:H+ antiporter subunit F